MQILIIGMHRSGTSLTTRLVNMLGAYFGPPMGRPEITIDNPKGFWEHPDVFRLNEALLGAQSDSWKDLPHFPLDAAAAPPQTLQRHIGRIIGNMEKQRPWVLKDPRFCLTLPFWRPHLECPVGVVVSRNPVEVALSLQARDGFSLEFGVALWEHYAVSALSNVRGLPHVHVRHHAMLQDPLAATARLYADLCHLGVTGLSLPEDKLVLDFIDPALYRSKPPHAYPLTDAQAMLFRYMEGEFESPPDLQVSAESRALMTEGNMTCPIRNS